MHFHGYGPEFNDKNLDQLSLQQLLSDYKSVYQFTTSELDDYSTASDPADFVSNSISLHKEAYLSAKPAT